MNKENNKSAAGRRPSAVVARINLQAEWSALKGTESNMAPLKSSSNLHKKQSNMKTVNSGRAVCSPSKKESSRNQQLTSDILRGVVALVEVGSETRALPLRAALAALGASVLPVWSPLVTHLIWTQGGSRSTRARARALACRVVSPLWVEACAAGARRLPERTFPALPRPSDLPSPATLTAMLKKVERENIDITNLLSDSDDAMKFPRLRISTESEHDTSRDTTNDTSRDTNNDTSRDTTNVTSRDTTKDTSINTTKETTTDVESRVNTAPRRALPKLSETLSPVRPAKSRRKLFTARDPDRMDGEESDETAMPQPIVKRPSIQQPIRKQLITKQPNLPQHNKKELARAERVAKKILAGCTQATNLNSTFKSTKHRPRIVLTGMSRTDRQFCIETIRRLKGKVQTAVDKYTTHVVLGDCGGEGGGTQGITGTDIPHKSHIKARTHSALCGAARGCPVVSPAWVAHCGGRGGWGHHTGYEVLHLKKLSQKARVERAALCKQRHEYAYDVFNGMRVRLKQCEQTRAAKHLLVLCGATVYDDTGETENGVQNGGRTQDGGLTAVIEKIPKFANQEYDIKIGKEIGDIMCKWVFDSVAAGRMRTTRRYIIKENSFNCELATLMGQMTA